MNVFRYGFFSYQFFCHKLMRWLVPYFLLVTFPANLALAPSSPGFVLLLGGQVVLYGIALWGWRRARGPVHPLLKVLAYFVSVNAAIMLAWLRFFKGERVTMWDPSKR